MPWTIELTEDGRFSISTSAPAPQVDAVYERQKRINDRLGGRIVAAYIAPGTDVPAALLTEIGAAGFDALVVVMETAEEYDALLAEVDAHGLWDPAPDPEGAPVLMATPSGFRRIATGAEFRAWLPAVDEIEIV